MTGEGSSGEGERPGAEERALPRWVDDAVSALQAAFGEVVEREARGLATPLAAYDDGRPLPLTREALGRARPNATGRVVVLVHGLGCHERAWGFPRPPGAPPDTYGTRLARELGFTAYAVRYNTGLAIGHNGASLAAFLEALVEAHPHPVHELVLVGHSMGGLVARAACLAARPGAAWLRALRQVITLGSPHEGAPLEHLAHHAAAALGRVGTTATDVLRDVIEARSRGIRDLRSGRLGHDGPEEAPVAPRPWPGHVRLQRVVGLVDDRMPLGALIGDGMVRAASASAGEGDGEVVFVRGVSHLGLLHDERVYAALRRFCEGDGAPRTEDRG